MAVNKFSTIPSNSTDANFRAWIQGLSTALASIGLVQTADTGQINTATVLAPTVANTFQGYQVWRFNDAHQAASPVFLKLAYGVGASLANPAIIVEVGRGTDGAGNVNALGKLTAVTLVATSEAVTRESHIAGDAGSLLAAMWHVGSSPILFNIERTKDANGADTATGVCLVCQQSNGAKATSQLVEGNNVFTFRQNTVTTSPGTPTIHLEADSSLIESGDVQLMPFFPRGNALRNPLRNIASYFNTDFALATQIAVDFYGANRLFVTSPATGVMLTGATNRRLALRDE